MTAASHKPTKINKDNKILKVYDSYTSQQTKANKKKQIKSKQKWDMTAAVTNQQKQTRKTNKI